MEGYMHATFGNTGSTASFLSLVIPAMLCAVLNRSWSRAVRVVALAALTLAVLNAIIVQSRTLFLTLALGIPLILLAHRIRLAWLAVVIAAVAVAIVLPLLGALDELYSLTIGAIVGSQTDYSVLDRTDAMWFATRTIRDNWVTGLGPGGTLEANPYTSAHEFLLQQGSELGIVGLLAAALLCALVLVRATLALWGLVADRATRDEACFLAGAAAFLFYAVIANVPLGENVVNAWSGVCGAFLGIAEAVRTRGVWPEPRPLRVPVAPSQLAQPGESA
jgi:O-antigen ligase